MTPIEQAGWTRYAIKRPDCTIKRRNNMLESEPVICVGYDKKGDIWIEVITFCHTIGSTPDSYEEELAAFGPNEAWRVPLIWKPVGLPGENITAQIAEKTQETTHEAHAKTAAATHTSDGSTAPYYELPPDSAQLQDLISHRDMNAQIGEIFRACYRMGRASHSNKLRDARKILYYATAEVARLEKQSPEAGDSIQGEQQ